MMIEPTKKELAGFPGKNLILSVHSSKVAASLVGSPHTLQNEECGIDQAGTA